MTNQADETTAKITAASAPPGHDVPNAPNNTENNEASWHLQPGMVTIDDPLLGCLLVLTKMEHRPFSKESLTVGLPLVDHKLTPELFIRAAKRADLSAQIIKRPLAEIPSLVLPVVLLLKNQQACVLTSLEEKGMAKIIHPETGEGTRRIKLDKLTADYIGYAIFTRPTYMFDSRSKVSVMEKDPKHWFLSVMQKTWPFYIEITVATLMINLFAVISPLFAMNVYDRVVPNNAFETLIVLSVGIAMVYVFDFLLKMLRSYFIDIAGKKSDILLSAAIFEHMLGMKMEARPESVGSFANNISQFEGFRDFMTSATISALIDLPFTIVFIIMVYAIGGPMTYVSVASIPLVILAGFIIQAPLNKIIKESYRYTSQKQSMLIESLICVETIKTLGAESVLQKKWEHLDGMASKNSIKQKILSNLAANICALIGQASSVVLIIVGVDLIADGKVTMGALIACNMLNGKILQPLGQISSLITRYHQAMTSFKSVDNMMQMPSERVAGKTPLIRSDLRGAIEFNEVTFKYPRQAQPILNKVSFTIKPGERVGVIGKIGSGKTTISKLLLNLYEPTEGGILFDGTEAKQLDPVVIRRNIGYVPQDILLFYGTIKDNITMGAPYIDDNDVLRAAEISGLGDYIARTAKGFDLDVGERGDRLSGGQRQQIAIARALLLDPKILMFDEPTNMMDNSAEEIFKARLQQILPGKTLILITHKSSLLGLVNRLILFDAGKIIADGPTQEVIKALAEGKILRAPNA